MLKVGLTGGYATGKTFVASELERLGCRVLHADRLGHLVLEPGGEAYAPVVEAFGPSILNADGTINRKRLGELVFGSPERLEILTGFVHPAVFRLEEQFESEFAAADPDGISIYEAAILIEAGRYTRFDRLILTGCDPEVQIARGMKRDGLTRDEVLQRLSHQLPFEEKKKHADFIIDTSGEKAGTLRQIGAVFCELKKIASARSS
ncbi:MAG TPA: dephospho-CoA kinase [Bryobacteraceae bacterium]|jgi:dephospho-CoA kinase|nr:dephospho-CoA kinase [Bryobacteraceae bacterium]